MAAYETVVGLEVHVQCATRSKLFCGCKTDFGAQPNTQVCEICLGLPGVLPVLNERAVELLAKTALAVGATVSSFSKFDRKNYFYPDLPKGYQISQFDKPLTQGGGIAIELDGIKKRIGLTRIHLEEDAGKLIHGEGASWVDINRAGVPLMEMVSEPDMRSPQEAFEYLRALKQILQYLEVSDCNMEEGSLRCDANVSLRPAGAKEFGTKIEIKNLNSFSNVRKALEYEVKRQAKVLDEGGSLRQETRLWNEQAGETRPMRSKESAHDYRYFPEPDLVPVQLDPATLEKWTRTLPELPAARRDRFARQYKLPPYDAAVLTAQKDLADYFEECVRGGVEGKTACNWIMTELMGKLNEAGKTIAESPVTPKHIVELMGLIKAGKISGKIAKEVFVHMFTGGKQPEAIVQEMGLQQISNESDIIGLVQEAIGGSPKVVDEYKAGKTNALGFLVGQVMKKSKGRANPQLVNKLLKEQIAKG